MKKLLSFIVNSLVDQKRKVEIKSTSKNGEEIINLKLAPEDIGKIIGKKGKTIKAIKDLLRAKAIKEGKRVELILEEN